MTAIHATRYLIRMNFSSCTGIITIISHIHDELVIVDTPMKYYPLWYKHLVAQSNVRVNRGNVNTDMGLFNIERNISTVF